MIVGDSPDPSAEDMARHWPLDRKVTFLNHGSFGACPIPVLEAQSEWRARMERQPVAFLAHELERHLDDARGRLATFVNADPDDLAFLPNATTGINTVLRSLTLQPTDEVLTTDHEYNAVLNAIDAVCTAAGARPVVAEIPFPVRSENDVIDAVLARVTARTRLVVISHVSSPTAVVFPIGRIVAELAARGIETLVDGAHAPGMVPLDIGGLGAAYYAGNAHKWLCAPKGAGFLHVRRDRQPTIRPLVVSHGANSPRRDRSAFRLEFDWTGTLDATPYLAIPAAIDFLGSLLPGGWPQVMQANRLLVSAGRQAVLGAMASGNPAPEGMVGSMAAIELSLDLPPPAPDPSAGTPPDATYPPDGLHDVLLERYAIEVPVYSWPHAPAGRARRRLLRISAQLYNSVVDYERLASAVRELTEASPDES